MAAIVEWPRRPHIEGMARTWIPLLALAVATPAAAQVDPALTAALHELDPGLSVTEGAGAVRSADFDGDGRMDVAALVSDGRRSALVAFHRTDAGYRAHSLHGRLPDGPVRLRVAPPGRLRTLDDRGHVDLERSSIELIFPGRSSVTYAWRDGRYRAIPTETYAEVDGD